MKILYITADFQHPKVRGSTRCYYFGKALAKHHTVTTLTINRKEIDPKALSELQTFLRIFVFNASVGAETSGIVRKISGALALKNAVRKMRDKFLELLRKESFDAVLLHGKSVFPVINGWYGLPLVIDFCEATSMRIRDRMRFESPMKRFWLKQRLQKYQKVEQQMIRKTPYLAFISYRDRDAVMEQRPGVRIVPNGVDLKYWQRRNHQARPNCLVFTGVMDYRPNDDAAIVGRNPMRGLKEKAAKNPEVTVTGFVEDMRDYLEQGSIFVAPLRYASGVQNKVLEALAMEVPVLCSSTVANGLKFEDGRMPSLRLANAPGEFVEQLVEMLNDATLREKLATAGRDFVEQRFVWEENVKILEQMLQEAIGEYISETTPHPKHYGNATYGVLNLKRLLFNKIYHRIFPS
jgi:glycosyltransferase involved in cell wall biosynthesis